MLFLSRRIAKIILRLKSKTIKTAFLVWDGSLINDEIYRIFLLLTCSYHAT